MAALDAKKKHVLLVLTSHDKLGETDKQTGWWVMNSEICVAFSEIATDTVNLPGTCPKLRTRTTNSRQLATT